MSIIKKTKNVLKKSRKAKYEFWYHRYYKYSLVKNNTILLESTHGKSFNSHLYYIAKELNVDEKYKVFVVSRDPEKIKTNLAGKGITNVHVVKHLSKEYCKLLATCEYLINDTTFWAFFNKRKGQKYFNVWHGTPLKNMGKDMESPIDVSNVQRNFYMSDKIVFSNEYTKEIMVKANNLSGVYTGDIVVGPSPRNSILYDETAKKNIRMKYAPNNEKIIVYMPTWRGTIGGIDQDSTRLEEDLIKISNSLNSNTKLFVKLHPFQVSGTEFSLPNIYPFPDEELYEFLAGTDMLVTDYSSIMYDFLNTGKPIVLYVYDKEEYFKQRGVYEDIFSYPFVIVENTESLIMEINKEHKLAYTDMINKFCKHDNLYGTRQLVEYLFLNKKENVKEYNIHNGKETVAILSGGFWDNGITSALLNTLEGIDTSKRNYIVFFGKNKLQRQHFFRVRNLPENVLYYPVPGQMNGSLMERFLIKRYLFSEFFSNSLFERLLNLFFKKRLYNIEFKRIFGNLNIDYFIHYTGFERKYAEMSKHIPVKSIIYVHTDMFKEYQAKKSFNKQVLFGAYKKAFKVAIVNEKLKESLISNLPFLKDKIRVVNNFLGENKVQQLGSQDLMTTLEDVEFDFIEIEELELELQTEIQTEINEFTNGNDVVEEPADKIEENSNLLTEIKTSLEEEFKYDLAILNEIVFYEQQFNLKNNEIKLIIDDLSKGRDTLNHSLIYDTYYSILSQHYYYNKLLYKYNHLFDEIDVNTNSYELKTKLLNLGLAKLDLLSVLKDPSYTVFVNIGRYAYEKGHERLIESFERINKIHSQTILIIVAPHGPLKLETITRVKESFARKNIYILGRMSNPYALLKACDAHVLSSYYEGLGLVAFEALAVGTDLITVNLPETVKHLDPDTAIIVDNSTEGLFEGMQQYMIREQPFSKLNFNSKLNDSIHEFEELFS